jgi:copper resistance protein C
MKISRLRSLLQDVFRAGLMTAVAVTLILIPRIASAHAVLVHSAPIADAVVSGTEVPISMKFNSRVDGSRSTLLLNAPDGRSKPLAIDPQSSPDTLATHAAGLPPGRYAIRWQVLATDGHITRGEIHFTVK